MTTDPMIPHPTACQIDGCTGRVGQVLLSLRPGQEIRVCLYHYVVLTSCLPGASLERK